MASTVVSLVLSGLLHDTLKIAISLVVLVIVAIAFTLSCIAIVLGPFFLGAPAAGPISLPNGAGGAAVVPIALSQLGKPYVWGGNSPTTSFDCSGLVQWAYGQVGVSLPRTAQEQYDATMRLSPADLKPGDLVFFAATYASADVITHVGVYLGDGMMVNAPAEGEVIQELPVFSGYWADHYAGAGRVPG